MWENIFGDSAGAGFCCIMAAAVWCAPGCWGDGRQGMVNGFVTLTEQDVINIYHLMD